MVARLLNYGCAPIPDSRVKEALSVAFVSAISAQAGLTFQEVDQRDDYGVDGTFYRHTYYDELGKRSLRRDQRAALDCQIKATTVWSESNNSIVYDLDAASQRKLAEQNREGSPVLLLVLSMPRDRHLWAIAESHINLRLQRSCYYYYVESAPTKNKSSITVHIPKDQCLTPEALVDLVEDARLRRR